MVFAENCTDAQAPMAIVIGLQTTHEATVVLEKDFEHSMAYATLRTADQPQGGLNMVLVSPLVAQRVFPGLYLRY